MDPRDNEEIINVDGVEYTVARSTVKLKVTNEPPSVRAVAAVEADQVGQFWQDGINSDLVYTQFLLDTEGPNLNWDYMPRPVLMASFKTAKLKPLNHDHMVKESASMVFSNKDYLPARSTIFGVMTSSALSDAEANVLGEKEVGELKTDDVFGRPDSDKLCVVAWAVMWNFLFPKTVGDVVTYAADNCMHVSMERWIKRFDFLYRDKKGVLSAMSKQDAIDNGCFEKWKKREQVNNHPIYRRSLEFTYGGVATTMIPANEMASFVESPNPELALASVANSNPALRNLLDRHAEIHRLCSLSQDVETRKSLETEHAWIHKCVDELRR
jgi:hypothetical protein